MSSYSSSGHPVSIVDPRRTVDPAPAWLGARIAEIAAELDQPAVTAGPAA